MSRSAAGPARRRPAAAPPARALPWALLIVSSAAACALGCATERPFVWVHDLAATAGPIDGDGVIHARDTIAVAVQDQPSLSGEFVVGDGGAYAQPMLGSVVVEGRRPADVATELGNRLRGAIVNPHVTVAIARVAPIHVSVIGEVKSPGAYDLSRNRSVAAALAAAGWLTDFAAKDRIFVVRTGGDGPQRIRFRAQELTGAEPHSAQFRLRDGDVVVAE
jgi:polysaccharide export outer membrane protein